LKKNGGFGGSPTDTGVPTDMSRTWEDLRGLGPSPDDGIRRRQSPIRVGAEVPWQYVEGVRDP
jgi:hypothetical protein